MKFSVKSLIVVPACMLIASHSPTSGLPNNDSPSAGHSGIFVGIQGGSILGVSKNSRVRLGGVFGYNWTRDSLSGTNGIVGGQAFMGTTYCHMYYYGMEAWANQSFLTLKLKDDIYFAETLKLKLKESYGVAARIGIILGPSLLYLKPGVVVSKREISSKFQGIYISGPSGPSIPSHKNHKYMCGFALGGGLDLPIYHNQFIIGAEVNGIFYQKFKYIHPMPTGIAGDIKTKFNLNTYTCLFKFSYKLYS